MHEVNIYAPGYIYTKKSINSSKNFLVETGMGELFFINIVDGCSHFDSFLPVQTDEINQSYNSEYIYKNMHIEIVYTVIS